MAGFDITSILDFQPPKYICPACRGLHAGNLHERLSGGFGEHRCPVCEVRLVMDEQSKGTSMYDFLQMDGYTIDQRNLFQHATTLAQMVRDSRKTKYREPWPTMRMFFEALSRAQHFVHFSSWGMSHIMVGALKVTSMRVPVYGFVSGLDSSTRVELTEHPRESPNLHARAIPSRDLIYDAPHQKIVIIDGLLAFKGSTNLTGAGMRRADRGLDLSETVTDFRQVTELNNKYFAPVWRKLTFPDETFVCSTAPF